MSHDFERHTVSFVIRLWQEPAAGKDASQWRGQIEHVPSGEQTYFQISNSLWEFFSQHLPMMNAGSPARSGLNPSDEVQQT